MKKDYYGILVFSVFLLFQNTVYGQFNSSYLKLIAKENYVDAEKKLLKDLQKEPTDVEMNFSMAILYITSKYPGYNSEKAYESIMKAKDAFENTIKEKDIKKLNKIPINKDVIESYIDTICHHALNEAIDINTSDIYEKYLSTYRFAPEEYTKQVIALRNEAKYKIALEKNTVEGFQEFIRNYPDAKQVSDAVVKRNQLAFEKVRRLDKIPDYKEFINRYPDATEVIPAYERIYELAYIQAERENTSAAYKFFTEEYPSSKQYNKALKMMEKRQYLENTVPGNWKKYKSFIERFPANPWKSFAQDSIFMIGSTSENLEILNYCVDSFTDDKKQKALLTLYKIFTMDGEKMTLDMFYSRYDDEVFNDVKLDDYKLAALGDSLMRMIPKEMNKPIFENYIKAAAPKEKAFRVIKKLLMPDIDAKDWAAAFEKAKSYSQYFGGKNKSFDDFIYFLGSLKNAPKPIINVTPETEKTPAASSETKSEPQSETPPVNENSEQNATQAVGVSESENK